MSADVNGDGRADLVAEFLVADLHLTAASTSATLTGWLYSSQAFFGTADITMVSTDRRDGLRGDDLCEGGVRPSP